MGPRTGRRNRGGVRLTGMAGGARIASVCAVTGKGVPGLGTFTPMFTIAWQTPKRRQTQPQSVMTKCVFSY